MIQLFKLIMNITIQEQSRDLIIINRIIRVIFTLNPLWAFLVFITFSITVTSVYLIPKFILYIFKI